MINGRRGCVAVLVLAAVVLTATAMLRSAEYDEQYTLLVTAGEARPTWPTHAITVRDVTDVQSGTIAMTGVQPGDAAVGDRGPLAIMRILRQTDVHPPLYFLVAAGGRALGLNSLFALRLLSVCLALASLWLVGVIARQAAVPPATAMLFTLGCYGFAYTGTLARGFALAELLALAGVAYGLGRAGSFRRGVSGGVLLGLAAMTNYLASFVAVGAILGLAIRQRVAAASMAAGFALCMPPVAWFYLAQRNSRPGQFPDFAWWPAAVRLGRYAVANILGGLPLYADEPLRPWVTGLTAAFALLLAGLVLVRWKACGRAEARPVLLACALAPVAGLMALALTFHTTSIELRYLSFATPFAGLLLAGATSGLIPRKPTKRDPAGRELHATQAGNRPLPSAPVGRTRDLAWAGRGVGLAIGVLLLGVQSLAIGGLMFRPETMQPARGVAAAAEATNPDIVLVPFGNDGVGVVGSFAQEAAPGLPIMIVRDVESDLPGRLGPYHRVTVALLAQDESSRATLDRLSRALARPPWRALSRSGTVAVFEQARSIPEATEPEGAADVLRGVHDREVQPTPGNSAGADRRVRTTLGAAARESADACDLASDGPGAGRAVHCHLP